MVKRRISEDWEPNKKMRTSQNQGQSLISEPGAGAVSGKIQPQAAMPPAEQATRNRIVPRENHEPMDYTSSTGRVSQPSVPRSNRYPRMDPTCCKDPDCWCAIPICEYF